MDLVMASFDISLAEAEALLEGFTTHFDDGEIVLTVWVEGSLYERAAAKRLLEAHGFVSTGRAYERPLWELAQTERYIGINPA